MRKRRIILVTGLPRSGTTVTGDIVARKTGISAIYEPMNIQSGDTRFDNWFLVGGTRQLTQSFFRRFLDDLGALKLRLKSGVFPHERGFRRFAKILFGGRSRMSFRLARIQRADTLVVKDPFAIFCVGSYLDEGVDVIVTYRPCEAIAASYKRLNWPFKFDNFLQGLSDLTGDDYFELSAQARPDEVSAEVESAVILFRAQCRYLIWLHAKWAQENPGSNMPFLVVSTGDLPTNHKVQISGIFQYLSLGLDEKVKKAVEKKFAPKQTDNRSDAPSFPSGHPHSQKRDILAVNTYWKEVLNTQELEYVKCAAPEIEKIKVLLDASFIEMSKGAL